MKPRCLETRLTPYALKRRRYDNGTRTYELPETALRAIGLKRVKEVMDTYRRGEVNRKKTDELRSAILSRSDWKATAVAHELGCTEAYVRKVRNQNK